MHLPGLSLGVIFNPADPVHPALLPIVLPDDSVLPVEFLSISNNVVLGVSSHHSAIVDVNQRQPSGQCPVVIGADANSSSITSELAQTLEAKSRV